MAENQDVKENVVEQKLKALYELQTIVSKIDKIKILRGELPNEVQDLEDEIAGLQTRIKNIEAEIANLNAETAKSNQIITDSNLLIAKYNEQINNVSNNREYDHLNKEIEFKGLEIALEQKHIKEYNIGIERKNEDKERATATLTEKQAILAEKKEELDAIIVETKAEEEALREEAKRVEATITDERLLNSFKRTRKNAHNGLAVVTVSERGACSGCFNKIPAQKQLDIRTRKKIIVCEYCGRVLVDAELAQEINEKN